MSGKEIRLPQLYNAIAQGLPADLAYETVEQSKSDYTDSGGEGEDIPDWVRRARGVIGSSAQVTGVRFADKGNPLERGFNLIAGLNSSALGSVNIVVRLSARGVTRYFAEINKRRNLKDDDIDKFLKKRGIIVIHTEGRPDEEILSAFTKNLRRVLEFKDAESRRLSKVQGQ